MSHTATDATEKWIESCETETQLQTCKRWIYDTLICDGHEREYLINAYNRVINQRAWVGSKVALQDYTDHQPTDIT